MTTDTTLPDRPMKQVLSLGAGVQSTTVLLMSIHGELPPLDAVIFADTGWETQSVYRHLDWLVSVMREHGVPFHRVQAGNIKADALLSQIRGHKDSTTGERWASMPYFVATPDGRGMVKRQCTHEYKIEPIERCIKRQILGVAPRQRVPVVCALCGLAKQKSIHNVGVDLASRHAFVAKPLVRHWFGISHDERTRMRISPHPWCEYHYPLVEFRMTRQSCIDWCLAHGYPEPPRSACIACPFKNNREWRKLQTESPDEFADAVDFDQRIRDCGGCRGEVYVHSSLRPLGELDLRTDEERGQQTFGWDDECAGVCNV